MKQARFTTLDAVRAYARAWNNLDVSCLEPLLADDVHYASQWVFDEIDDKARLVEYLTGKMDTVRESPGAKVWVEVGETRPYPMYPCEPGPCALVAQGNRDNARAVVLFEVEGGRIVRIDMCLVPSPETVHRTGEYPR